MVEWYTRQSQKLLPKGLWVRAPLWLPPLSMAVWWNWIYTGDLKSPARKGLRVQIPLRLPIFMLKSFWRIWAKALGEKASADNCEADRIAIIRTLIVICYVITNIVIVAGVIRHWND